MNLDEKVGLMLRVKALKEARDELARLEDVLSEFLWLPRASFARLRLRPYENEFRDLVTDIDRVVDLIDKMPGDVHKYLDELWIEIRQTKIKIEKVIYELEKHTSEDK